MRNKFTPRAKPDEQFLPAIIGRVECKRHEAALGIPCFNIHPHNTMIGYLPAICNSRAKNAGFQGRISNASISLSKRK